MSLSMAESDRFYIRVSFRGPNGAPPAALGKVLLPGRHGANLLTLAHVGGIAPDAGLAPAQPSIILPPETLAGVATTEWMGLVLRFTPTWVFMPKYQLLPLA